MNKLKENTDTYRKCIKCDIIKPLTDFYKDKNRPLGFMYRCKECDKLRVDKRIWKERCLNMTDIQKENIKRASKKYRQTEQGKSISTLKAYQASDKKKGLNTDLTKYDILSIRGIPCTYCGFPSTGLDRINNKLGHTKKNTVPCCKECNVARMDNFTHEEMFEIGKVIAEIKKKRITNKIS